MSYFLGRTGTPTLSAHRNIEMKLAVKHLNIFKKKRQAASNMLTQQESLSNFIPMGVIQRISKDGKKYLEIIANPSTFANPENTDIFKPHHLSVTFSDKVDIIGTETLDSWISPFGPGNSQMDIESQSNRASTNRTAKIPYRIKPAVHHSTTVHSGFGLSIIDDACLRRSPSDETDTNTALRSNPPSSSSSSIYDEADRKQLSRSAQNTVHAPVEPKSVQELGSCLLSSNNIQSEDNRLRNCLAGQRICRAFSGKVHQMDYGQFSELSALQPTKVTKEPDQERPEMELEFSLSALQLAKLRREQKIRANKPRESQFARRDNENNMDPRLEKTIKEAIPSNLFSGEDKDINSSIPFSDESHRSKTQRNRPSNPNTSNQFPTTPPASQEAPSVPLQDSHNSDVTTWKMKQNQKPSSILFQDEIPAVTAIRSELPTLSPSTRTNTTRISPNTEIKPTAQTPSFSISSLFSDPSLGFTARTTKIRKHDQEDEALVAAVYTPTRRPKCSLGSSASRTRVLSASPILGTAFPAPPSQQRSAVHSPSAISGDGHNLWTGTGERKGKRAMRRLEGRIEALERENRMLEAALMAVLRTGGTLNGCPCGVLSGGEENVRSNGCGSERRENGMSVLEVYLGTRRRFGDGVGSATEGSS